MLKYKVHVPFNCLKLYLMSGKIKKQELLPDKMNHKELMLHVWTAGLSHALCLFV